MIRFTAILIAVCATVGLGSASATPRAPQPRPAPGLLRRRRRQTLPPITVSVPSTLRWTSSGPAFMLITDTALGGSVNSQAASGATYLKVGTYNLSLKVWAAWTIRIVPGVERPRSSAMDLSASAATAVASCPVYDPSVAPISSGRTPAGSSPSTAARGLSGSTPGQAWEAPAGPRRSHVVINASGTWTIGWKPLARRSGALGSRLCQPPSVLRDHEAATPTSRQRKSRRSSGVRDLAVEPCAGHGAGDRGDGERQRREREG